jgi:hypothetical protein
MLKEKSGSEDGKEGIVKERKQWGASTLLLATVCHTCVRASSPKKPMTISYYLAISPGRKLVELGPTKCYF